MFIVMEGTDGAGKSTQLQVLAETFRAAGLPVTATREPGGSTTLGRHLREILLSGVELGAQAEALLFAAERAEHVRTVIGPALERGDIVLCDRFIDSTLAYQGAGRGLPTDVLLDLSRFATGGLTPDLVIVLDLPPAAAKARQVQRGATNHLDEVGLSSAVRDMLLARAAQDPDRYTVVNAEGTIEQVSTAIMDALGQRSSELTAAS